MSTQGKDPDDAAGGREDEGNGGEPSDDGDREAADLRRRAEARLEEGRRDLLSELKGHSLDDVQEIVHELTVHQIELEMQNEELRQSRAELAASHERYFDLFDLAPVGYFTLTEDGRILEANLTGGELLGVPRGGLLDRPFTEFIHSDDQDSYYHHRRVVGNAGTPATCEIQMVRADGSRFHALLESAPSPPVDDRATFRTVVNDVTEQTRAAAERLLLEQRIQQVEKAESLSRMAGAMAHHFNNLLGVITGNLELVLERCPDDPERNPPDAVGDLGDALAGARKATDLTQLLLSYLGHVRSEPILMDLSEIGRKGISLLQIAMPPGTEVEADLPSPGPTVRVGPRDIQQLLTNLVTNAWEASEPGTASIHLSVSTVQTSEIPEEHRFPVGWEPNASSYACLEVRDKGPGIEPGTLNEVFDPFFSSKSFGRGLGLSVALGTVKAHGGALTVRTLAGQGSSFMVYLPEAEGPAAAPGKEDQVKSLEAQEDSRGIDMADRPPARQVSAEAATVLVVEDNEMVRRLAVRILERMGFRVLEAADGILAMEVYEAHRDQIKVVLCDVTMPRMGGWETLSALRRIDPEVPVILTSGYDQASATPLSHPEQPDAFVSKPWKLEQLREVLSEVIGGFLEGGGLNRWE